MKTMDEVKHVESHTVNHHMHELRVMKSGTIQWLCPDGKGGLRVLFRVIHNPDHMLMAQEADVHGDLGELFELYNRPVRDNKVALHKVIAFCKSYVASMAGQPWSNDAQSMLP